MLFTGTLASLAARALAVVLELLRIEADILILIVGDLCVSSWLGCVGGRWHNGNEAVDVGLKKSLRMRLV